MLVQYTPLWDMAFDRVITLNLDKVPLDASLNAVERDLGLPVTDFASIAEFRRLRDEHYAIPCRYFGPGPIELRRFRRHETQPFPSTRSPPRRCSKAWRNGTTRSTGAASPPAIPPARCSSPRPGLADPTRIQRYLRLAVRRLLAADPRSLQTADASSCRVTRTAFSRAWYRSFSATVGPEVLAPAAANDPERAKLTRKS